MAHAEASRDLVDPGALLATTHELDDGSRARLRLTRPSDLPKIEAFLEGLSPETRARRFLVAAPRVPQTVIRHFAFYDPRERLTLGATMLGDRGEEIVGLADVALLATGLAEIGIVVDDEHQGRGLGTLLSEAVASLAIQRGATHLKAEMLGDNTQMLRLMQRLGPTVRTVEDGNVVAYTRLPAARRHAA
jgi:RimJ/RimL family protein N-acetyltransferase